MSNKRIKPKLFVILGPTAIGKSSVAFRLAKNYGASIVNADSLQVYKYFDIGTSKPSPGERELVPHFLVDIIEPQQEFNAAIFKKIAESVINKLADKNKKIIVVGGTFLYVKILLSGLIDESELNPDIRNKIELIKENKGLGYLYRLLNKIDPESASKIESNDYIRIQRALEVYFSSGITMSELQKRHNFESDKYEVCKIGLQMEREMLNQRINNRVDKMMEYGFEEEVVRLRNMELDSSLKPMKSIGYKELNSYLSGNLEKEEAINLIKQNTRRYAKRQLTWLRKEKEIIWFNSEGDIKLIEEKFTKFFGI